MNGGTERRTEPWRDGDLLMVCIATLAGLAVIVSAWFGAGGTVSPARQAAWLNLAVAGFAVSSGGLCLWLLRARRAVGERRIALISLAPPADSGDPAPAPRRAAAPDGTAAPRLVRAPGMNRFHRPDCPLVAGKDVVPAGVDDGDPCGVCAA